MEPGARWTFRWEEAPTLCCYSIGITTVSVSFPPANVSSVLFSPEQRQRGRRLQPVCASGQGRRSGERGVTEATREHVRSQFCISWTSVVFLEHLQTRRLAGPDARCLLHKQEKPLVLREGSIKVKLHAQPECWSRM